ncbi:sensor histidine kinase [Rubellicoccus peritrichatus]|uniref:histidine kinase n=1 Tax=Rubellicoccus peritrichatus TaxID=3080537 RepID=A0AAQ3QT38_9BACT|nr:sensor histidine kinase [Puniceicoccus sp. CR14]WOO40891.1 sensor histidine kinase [Puniceicoccus sp. CR14]
MDATWTVTFISIAGIVVIGLLIVSKRMKALEKKENDQHQFSQQLLIAQEDERKRIASELHDSLGQELLAVKSRLEVISTKYSIKKSDLDELSNQMTSAIERTRNLSHDLRPPHLERFGLPSSLTTLAEEISERSGIPILTKVQQHGLSLPPEAEITLFRIAQEALINMVEHSDAGEASLYLEKTGSYVKLSISDDGRGFHSNGVSKGIHSMQERAQIIGATFECNSQLGQGTQITVEVEAKLD